MHIEGTTNHHNIFEPSYLRVESADGHQISLGDFCINYPIYRVLIAYSHTSSLLEMVRSHSTI